MAPRGTVVAPAPWNLNEPTFDNPKLDVGAPPPGVRISSPIATPEQANALIESYLQSSPDRESARARIDSASMMAALTGLEPQFVLEHYDLFARQWSGQGDPLPTHQVVKNTWDAMWLSIELGELRWRQMNGDASPELAQQIAEIKSSMPEVEEPFAGGLLRETLKSAAMLLPFIMTGATRGAQTGLAAGLGTAGTAAIAGQLGPQVAIPEEIVTVPAAFGVGFAVGTRTGMAQHSMEIESALLYDELLERNIDPDIARATALGGGALVAAIETVGAGSFPGAARILKQLASASRNRITARSIAALAGTAATRLIAEGGGEAIQEMAQQAFQIGAEELAVALNNEVNGTSLKQATVAEIIREIGEVGATTLLGAGALAVPGISAQVVSGARQMRNAPVEDAQPAAPAAGDAPTISLEESADELRQRYSDMLAAGVTDSAQAAEVMRLARNIDELTEAPPERPVTAAAPAWTMTRDEWADAARNDPTTAQSIEQPGIRAALERSMPQLTEEEVDATAIVFDLVAAGRGLTTNQMLREYFAPGVFATPEQSAALGVTGKRGATELLPDGRALLHAFSGADVSTSMHELFHVVRKNMLTEEEAQTAERLFAVEDGVWTEAQEEAFATGFEEYLRSGVEPEGRPELVPVFERIAQWFERIYHAIRDRWVLPDELRSFYDGLIRSREIPDVSAELRAELQEAAGDRPLFQDDVVDLLTDLMIEENRLTEDPGEAHWITHDGRLVAEGEAAGPRGAHSWASDVGRQYNGRFVRFDEASGVAESIGVPTARQIDEIADLLTGAPEANLEVRSWLDPAGGDAPRGTAVFASTIIREPTRADILRFYARARREQVGNEILFQPGDEHDAIVQKAIADGEYVPDAVLMDYEGEPWADAERERRETLRRDALDFASEDEYVQFALAMDADPRGVDYYREIYRGRESARPTNVETTRQWLEGLTPEMLKGYVAALAEEGADLEGLHVSVATAAQRLVKGNDLTEGHLKAVMDQVRDDPIYWRQKFAEAVGDDIEIQAIERELEQNAEASELLKVRETNRQLRRRNKKLDQSLEQTKQRIRSLESWLKHAERRTQEVEASAAADLEAATEAIQSARQEARTQTRQAREEERAAATDAIRSAREEARLSSRMQREELRAAVKEAKAELRDHYRQKLYYERMAKRIMRPPSGAIHREEASQIRLIQKNYVVHKTRTMKEAEAELRARMSALPADQREAVRRQLDTQAIDEMAPAEVERLLERIEKLKTEGRMRRAAEVGEERTQATIWRFLVVTEVSKGGGLERIRSLGTGAAERALRTSKARLAYLATLDMDRIAELLGPTTYDLLRRQVNAATDEKLRNVNRREDAWRAAMQELRIRPRDLAKEYRAGLTFDEAVGIHIAMQNEDSRAAVLQGNDVTPEQLEAVWKLPSKWKRYAEALYGLFPEEATARLVQTFGEQTNQVMELVERYFPMRRRELSYETAGDEIAADILARTPVRASYPNRNFTKTRQHLRGPQPPIRLDATSVGLAGVDRQEHYTTHAKLIRQLHRVFDHRDVRQALVQRWGRDAYELISTYINKLAAPDSFRAHTAMERLTDRIRVNFTVASLAFRVPTALLQTASVLLYLPHSGAGHLLSGIAQANPFNLRSLRDFVYERDPQVRNRSVDPFVAELKAYNQIPAKSRAGELYKEVVAFTGTRGMAMIQAMDKLAVLTGWKAVYDKVYAETKNERKAIEAAQRATMRTQPVGMSKDVPAIYDDRALRWFLMFTTPLNRMWNMLAADVPYALATKRVGHAVTILASLVMAGFLVSVIKRKRLPDDPEEWALDATRAFVDSVPFVGSTVSSKLRGEWWADRGINPLPVIISTANAIEALTNQEARAPQRARSVVRAASDLGRATGLPLPAAQMIYEALIDQDTLELDFNAWELVGGPPEERD